MAIRKRTRTGGKTFFQVYWKNPVTGKQESREFEQEKDAARYNDDILFRLKYERNSFIPESDRLPLTVGILLGKYLKASSMAESTKESSFYRLKAVIKFCGGILAAEFTRKDFKELENYLLGLGQKQNTVQRTLSIITSALNWGVDQELMPEGYQLPRYTCRRGQDTQLQPPTATELSKILGAAPPHLVRAILLAWHLGLRVGSSELLKVQWSGVDWEAKTLFVEAAKKNKAQPWRVVDLAPGMYANLQRWHAEDIRRDVMPKTIVHYQGAQIGTIKRTWRTTLERAGITRRIRPYDLRHAFATQALSHGADIKAVSEVMGHSDAAMILRNYQHVIGSQRKDAINLVPEVKAKQ